MLAIDGGEVDKVPEVEPGVLAVSRPTSARMGSAAPAAGS